MTELRINALNLLKNLSEAAFREVVFTYQAPRHYLPSSTTSQVTQAIALLEYAERQGDPQLTRMLDVIAQVRGETANDTSSAITSTQPQNILMLAANPKMDLRLDEEIRAIENGLQRAQFRERFAFVSRQAVRREDLIRALLDLQPVIVQFSGHGQGDAGIWIQGADGKPHALQAAALGQLFGLCSQHVQCVFLNACFDKFLSTLEKFMDEILNYFIRRHNSGFVEGLNNKVKVIKRRCYGLLNHENLFRRLDLDMRSYSIFLS